MNFEHRVLLLKSDTGGDSGNGRGSSKGLRRRRHVQDAEIKKAWWPNLTKISGNTGAGGGEAENDNDK